MVASLTLVARQACRYSRSDEVVLSQAFTAPLTLLALVFIALASGSAVAQEKSAKAAAPRQVGLTITGPLPADYGQRPSFAFTKIAVSDMNRAIHFYSDVLGMKEAAHVIARPPAEPTLVEIMLKYPDEHEPWLVLVKASPQGPINAYGQLGIITTDIKGLFARVKAAGLPIKRDVAENAEGDRLLGVIEDPDGHSLEVMQITKK